MLTLDQLYLLIPAFLVALVGAMVQFAYKTKDQELLTNAQRGASTAGGWVLTCLLAIILGVVANWNIWVVTFLAFFGGMGMEKFIRLYLESIRASKDVTDFANRNNQAYNSMKSIGSAPSTSSDQPAEPTDQSKTPEQP